MSWLFLVFAGIMEIGWPVGLKIAQNPDTKWYGIFLAIIFMTISGGLLWAAQRRFSLYVLANTFIPPNNHDFASLRRCSFTRNHAK